MTVRGLVERASGATSYTISDRGRARCSMHWWRTARPGFDLGQGSCRLVALLFRRGFSPDGPQGPGLLFVPSLPGPFFFSMTPSARYEISVDGVVHEHRDLREFAREAANALKALNPHSKIVVRDRWTSEEIDPQRPK